MRSLMSGRSIISRRGEEKEMNTDFILKWGSIILMIFAIILQFAGKLEQATFLMAQAAFCAATVNWRE